MNEREQPSLLGSAAEIIFLLLIVIVIVMIPLLLCDWVARLVLPIPVAATPEIRQSLTEQRESMSKLLFAFIWAILSAWAVISS